MTKELTTYDGEAFAITTAPDAASYLSDAMQQLDVTAFDLKRLRVPSGGMQSWEVETGDGLEPAKEVDGIIALIQSGHRQWWLESLEDGGGGSPPSCHSTDGIHGQGINSKDPDAVAGTHKCAECPWSQWGSDRKGGKGKDCRESSAILFFPQGELLPTLLMVPPTSLKALKRYILELVSAGRAPGACVTRLALEKVEGEGPAYSRIVFRRAGDLGEDEAHTMREVCDAVKAGFAGVAAAATQSGE